MLLTDRLVIASVNAPKFSEFANVIQMLDPKILPLRADRVVRNAEKLRLIVDWKRPCMENAIAKARILGRACHDPILSESACIELGEGPEKVIIPDDDLDLCYTTVPGGEPMARVLRHLNGKPRPAVLDSAVCLLIEGIMLQAFEKIEGTVICEERGNQGCGFDAIFIPDGKRKTLAEMNANERLVLSPRSKTICAVLSQQKQHHVVLARPQAG